MKTFLYFRKCFIIKKQVNLIKKLIKIKNIIEGNKILITPIRESNS